MSFCRLLHYIRRSASLVYWISFSFIFLLQYKLRDKNIIKRKIFSLINIKLVGLCCHFLKEKNSKNVYVQRFNEAYFDFIAFSVLSLAALSLPRIWFHYHLVLNAVKQWYLYYVILFTVRDFASFLLA